VRHTAAGDKASRKDRARLSSTMALTKQHDRYHDKVEPYLVEN